MKWIPQKIKISGVFVSDKNRNFSSENYSYPNYFQQESIPVGCVPSTAVAVGGGGLSSPVHAGIPAQGDVCPSACWDTPPSTDKILDTRLRKHYLSATTVADGKNGSQ